MAYRVAEQINYVVITGELEWGEGNRPESRLGCESGGMRKCGATPFQPGVSRSFPAASVDLLKWN